jgi:hypothetical protein
MLPDINAKQRNQTCSEHRHKQNHNKGTILYTVPGTS